MPSFHSAPFVPHHGCCSAHLSICHLKPSVSHPIQHPQSNSTVWYREDGWNSNSSVAGIGSDWFEGALVRPDLVLSDIARALNSSAVPKVLHLKSHTRL